MINVNSTKVLPFIIITVFIFLAVINIYLPGLQFDELLFEMGLFGKTTNFDGIPEFGNRKPLYLVSYTGSLKSFLQYPIFKIIDTSVLMARLPMILIGALSLWLVYKTTKLAFGERIALSVLAFISFDALFFNLHRTDVGPSALEFFFKICSFYIVLELFLDKSKINTSKLLILWLLLLLGLFNKANFIWYINSLLGSLVLIWFLKSYKSKKLDFKLHSKSLLLAPFIYLSCFFYYSFLNKKFSLIKPFDFNLFQQYLGDNLKYFFEKSFDFLTLKSANFYQYNLQLDWLGYFNLVFILVGLFLSVRAIIKKLNYIIIYIFFIFILTYAQLFLTSLIRQQMYIITFINPWHVFMIQPFVAILACWGWSQLFQSNYKFSYIFFFVILTKLILILNFHFAFKKQNAGDLNWSNSIYDLYRFTESQPRKIASIDWGTQSQLHFLSKTKDKYFDLTVPMNLEDSTSIENFKKSYFNTQHYFVFSGDTLNNWARVNARNNFKMIVKNASRKLKTIHEIKNNNGILIYKVVSVE